MTTVETIDFDQVFGEIDERLRKDQERRIRKPLVRIWDGDWNLVGEVHNEISAKFTLPENETGVGTIELPAQYYLSKWLTNHDDRLHNVHVTVDKDGARWGGMLDDLEGYKDDTGRRVVKASFKSDYEHLKNILAYSNPFLPPEIQFPRLWILFGPAKWALKLTLFVNLLRLQGLDGLWTLPDDPMDPEQWLDLDQSNWQMVVAPTPIGTDHSQFAIISSRFKYMHDVAKRAVADAQLTWQPRRYLDGDEPPWEGANLKHGCLVWDLVDNSGWDTETSFGGNIFTGLVRAFTTIGSDGMTEGVDIIDDPTFPPEYSIPGWKGTIPRAPGIILRDGERTGIQSHSFHWKPATATEFVTGGHSMPGVNELISATINMVGDLVAAALFIPPVGGMADALLKPLYTDVFLAFMKWQDIGRAQKLGWSHYFETWCEGADRAYTLSALIALRTGMWRTREQTSHTVTVADGVENLRIGERGKGNAFLGTRIGTTVRDWGKPGRVYVDRITELVLAWDRATTPAWTITVGHREPEDPVAKALEMLQDVMSIARDLGVL
ncbi:phage tail protein [Nocardia sp. FDAARGOS_372]|uniref:Gp37-like protein n=1 Tax=Nocardia sp. FDAARGOS_372 TaxID=2018066 RepID=UPI000BF0EB10|nr:phage tail protein [Nocardia sp. FDAARGOS_372]PEH74643.1 phage tail protein [Nocardia sp. FDAARGOS_372]